MRTSPLLHVAALIGALGVAACGGSSQAPPPSAATECTGCHGDATRVGTSLQQAAPPKDAHGQSATTQVTVGAHQAHVYGGVACATCHVVPPAGDQTHIAAPYATVIFSGNLVGAQGATVAPWNRDQPTCANYCHGEFTNGNRARPAWNSGAAMTCNSCHGAGTGAAATPPGGTHPQGQPDCSTCHVGYTTTSVNAAAHLNGQFDVGTLSCTACHGDGSRAGTSLQQAAPPVDSHGQSTNTLVTVGAHQAHVYGGVACATCHVIPPAGDTSHSLEPYASVTFSGNLVGAQGATVAPWNRDQPTCANYCHGEFTNGNRARPAWNSGAAVTCNSCHGTGTGAAATLPGGNHPQGQPDCSVCHTGYTTTAVDVATHLNGQFDVGTLSCTACHGDGARAGTSLQQAAPPLDSHGHSGTNEVTVGAHQAHVYGGVACATCHVIPAAGDITHSQAPYATVTFQGNVVGANGTPVAPWDRTQATCANYCHNPAMGGTVPTPLWTRSTPLTCGACHWDQQTATTSTGLHQLHVTDAAPPLDCSVCHGTGYSRTGVSGAALSTHADSLLRIEPLVGWQDPSCTGPRTCYAQCHSECRTWP